MRIEKRKLSVVDELSERLTSATPVGPGTDQKQRPIGGQPGGPKPLFVTDEADLARAYLAALETVQVGHGWFDPVFIAGDEDEKEHNLSTARRLLGWTPQSHLDLEV